MKGWNVTVKATITKTIKIGEAKDEEEAVEFAHQIFSVSNDGIPEKYEQDTISVTEYESNVIPQTKAKI